MSQNDARPPKVIQKTPICLALIIQGIYVPNKPTITSTPICKTLSN
uniref:Uncharacterized protein n=1 Tax=Rhizophora mucronata TaxID=61149 RepID=A0A2P2Q813_RHIMU